MQSTPPLVTIVIPCLNEEAYLDGCIRSVQTQDYPHNKIEVFLADGGSIDASREIIHHHAARDPRITLVENPEKIQSAGLNAMIRKARGEIIIRMDAHAEYRADFIRQCVAALEKTGAENVGGAARPKYRTRFQRAVCAALTSPLAIGGSKYRDENNEGYVESVFPGAFRRRVFATVGLFDPRAITNEDADINQRIIASGGRVYLSRDIVVYYYPRSSFQSLARQYFAYGKGRARTLLKHRRLPSVRPALPFLAILSEGALLATAPIHPLAPWTIGAYLALTGAEAVRVGLRAGLSTIPAVWAIFPVLHLSHGLGFASGLATYLRSPDWSPPETVDTPAPNPLPRASAPIAPAAPPSAPTTVAR